MGEVHCLSVGCADATVIHSGGSTFLVDAGGIEDHAELLPSNKVIKGVFITHQHTDHFSGLRFLKDKGYSIEYLVYSPYDRRPSDASVTLDEWNEFNSLKSHFENKGSKLYSPYRQDSWEKPWWSNSGAKFWVIGPIKSIAKEATREIHDACLVLKVDLGTKLHFCFAGDASDASLDAIAADTKNYCNGVLHVSHHGSANGASLDFIKKAAATHAVISTKSGVYENVPHATALQRYRTNIEKVYRTDVDGSLKWTF